jgi:hypothetical protein
VWSEAEGSLTRYLALVKVYTDGWEVFKKNLSNLVSKFPGQADLIMQAVKELGPAAPDMVAKILGGTPAEQKAAIDSFRYIFGTGFDELAREIAAGGTPAGVNMARNFTRGWGKPSVSVAVKPTELSEAWKAIVAYFAGKHITIDTNLGGYAGTKGYAEGGSIPGSPSTPVPIVAHGGEYVLTKGDTDLMKDLISAVSSGGTGGGNSGAAEALLGAILNAINDLPYRQKMALRTA